MHIEVETLIEEMPVSGGLTGQRHQVVDTTRAAEEMLKLLSGVGHFSVDATPFVVAEEMLKLLSGVGHFSAETQGVDVDVKIVEIVPALATPLLVAGTPVVKIVEAALVSATPLLVAGTQWQELPVGHLALAATRLVAIVDVGEMNPCAFALEPQCQDVATAEMPSLLFGVGHFTANAFIAVTEEAL